MQNRRKFVHWNQNKNNVSKSVIASVNVLQQQYTMSFWFLKHFVKGHLFLTNRSLTWNRYKMCSSIHTSKRANFIKKRQNNNSNNNTKTKQNKTNNKYNK